jgi:hypothetical protein
MNDTYSSGGVIHSNHELKLVVKTPNCITDPTIIVPLRIGNKAPTKIGSINTGQIYGALNTNVMPVSPSAMGGSNQDGESVIVPSAPPTGYSNPVVYSSAVPSLNIGGDPFSSPTAAVSFDSLLAEMDKSLNDLDIVTTCCNDPDWDTVLSTLTPIQFGQCISKVWSVKFVCFSMNRSVPRDSQLLLK